MNHKTKIYFSGICGSGMKPLSLLSSRYENYEVYGSDYSLNDAQHPYWNLFKKYNIQVFSEPKLEVLKSCNYYVYSSAIQENHIERQTATELSKNGILKVFHRMDFLNFLLKDIEIQIAIAGTHGKTSTTAMMGWVLQNLCLSPTIIVGGVPKFLPHSFKKGSGFIATYETDESDGSFLKSNSEYRLILNIDNDHLDYYKTFDHLVEAFYLFSKDCSICVINNDDEFLKNFPYKLKYHYIGYGLSLPEHHWYRYFLLGEFKEDILYIKIYKNNKEMIYDSKKEGIHFKFTGKHFMVNSLGVIGLIFALFLDYPTLSIRSLGTEILKNDALTSIIRILNRFSGVERRMDLIATYNQIDIYDDYGHHPKEIQKVIETLKEKYSGKIAVIFQPHRYTRTKELAREFANALELADDIYLLPLYSAGEEPITGVTSELIGRFIRKKVHYLENQRFEVIFYQNYSCAVFLGAGDISQQIRNFLSKIGIIQSNKDLIGSF